MQRNVKVIGISADALQEHYDWIDDIIEIGNKTAPTCVEYPIVCTQRLSLQLNIDLALDCRPNEGSIEAVRDAR